MDAEHNENRNGTHFAIGQNSDESQQSIERIESFVTKRDVVPITCSNEQSIKQSRNIFSSAKEIFSPKQEETNIEETEGESSRIFVIVILYSSPYLNPKTFFSLFRFCISSNSFGFEVFSR